MIEISYQPYVGLLHGNFVHTKMKEGKLHFFEMSNVVMCDELNQVTVDSLLNSEIPNVEYLGYVILKKDINV